MKEEKYLVSVVVPIYNVEKYVERCLKSIVNQTYKNIEILLVDDGSKDSSINICKRFARTDTRIKIFSQENMGLSMARNTGIENAKGEYICFIDSDDYITEDYVEKLLEEILKGNSDICTCDFWYVDEDNNKWIRKDKTNRTYTNIEAITDVLLDVQDTEVMAWNKLYKLELFIDNNIRFPKGKLHEDNFTTYKLYYYSKKISLINDRLYYYMQRDSSIMGKKFNIKRLDSIEAVNEKVEFFKDKTYNFSEELEFHELSTRVALLNNMIRDRFQDKSRKDLINSLNSKKREFKTNKYITRRLKMVLLLMGKDAKLYTFCLALLDKIKKRK